MFTTLFRSMPVGSMFGGAAMPSFAKTKSSWLLWEMKVWWKAKEREV